jgi:hypothetical protein
MNSHPVEEEKTPAITVIHDIMKREYGHTNLRPKTPYYPRCQCSSYEIVTEQVPVSNRSKIHPTFQYRVSYRLGCFEVESRASLTSTVLWLQLPTLPDEFSYSFFRAQFGRLLKQLNKCHSVTTVQLLSTRRS